MKRKAVFALLGAVIGMAIVAFIRISGVKETTPVTIPEDLGMTTEASVDADTLQNVVLEDEKDKIDVEEEIEKIEKANADGASAPAENAYDIAYENQLAEEVATATETTPEIKTITMYANASVNVRTEPSISAGKLGGLTKGQEVEVSAIAEEWATIRYKEKDGFVSAEYLSDKKPEEKKTVANNNVSGANASNTTKNNPAPTESVVISDDADETGVDVDTTGKTEASPKTEKDYASMAAKIAAETGAITGIDYGSTTVETHPAEIQSQDVTRAHTEALGIDYDSIVLH